MLGRVRQVQPSLLVCALLPSEGECGSACPPPALVGLRLNRAATGRQHPHRCQQKRRAAREACVRLCCSRARRCCSRAPGCRLVPPARSLLAKPRCQAPLHASQRAVMPANDTSAVPGSSARKRHIPSLPCAAALTSPCCLSCRRRAAATAVGTACSTASATCWRPAVQWRLAGCQPPSFRPSRCATSPRRCSAAYRTNRRAA